jgi:hypothetical protein
MRIHGRIWTIGLAMALVFLAAAAASKRRRDPAPVTKLSKGEAASSTVGQVSGVEKPEEPVESPTVRPASRVEELRAVSPSGPEGTLSGHVTSPEGPLPGALVKVEWVAAVRPAPEEALRLKRGGARRDREGVWWWTVQAATDEAGFFSIDGLPAGELRVRAGGQVQTVRAGQAVQLRTGSF